MSLRLSSKERKLLEEIPRHTTIKEAALAAGINPGHANQYLYRVRKKVRNAEEFLKKVGEMARESKLLKKVLTERS